MSKRFRDLKKQQLQNNNQDKPLVGKQKNAYIIHRVKAFIVDMFMIYIPILYIITYVFMGGKDDFQSSELAPFLGTILYGLIYAIFLSRSGQTPGKKAYEIKVVDSKTLEKIGFFRALLRFFAFIFTATTLLGLFLPLLRKDYKMLHDILANTSIVGVQEI